MGKYHFEKQGEYKWKGKKRNEFVYLEKVGFQLWDVLFAFTKGINF